MEIELGKLSRPFMLMKVGGYGDENLSDVMTRILREIGYEGISNPDPWYPFAYSHSPSRESVHQNIEDWKRKNKTLPERVQVLLCADSQGQTDWEGFRHPDLSRDSLINDEELTRHKDESWSRIEAPVDGSDRLPGHYLVCYDDKNVGYYAVVIKNL